MLTRSVRFAIVAGVVSAATASAAPPPPVVVSGGYTGSVVLGPVLLDGRYPLEIGTNAPGALVLATAATGAVSGTVTFAAATYAVAGRVRARADSVRLDVKGTFAESRLTLSAALRGSAFVGTVKLGATTAPCRIDVRDVGPILARYDLDLAPSKGASVAGAGTVTVGRETIDVAARGGVRKRRLALRMSGGKTLVRFDGATVAAGGATVTAPAWRGQGFGAAAIGTAPLVLTRSE